MYSPLRLLRFTAPAFCALALTGCASTNISSYVERGIDFTRYRTYTWGPADSRSTGDPRLDNNPFFQERVRASVETELATKGFERIISGTPDLVIHFHASINQAINVNSVDRQHGYCDEGDCEPYVYEAGTLLIDLVDARTNRVVWRGWARGTVDGAIDNQDRMEQRIDAAVMRILERLPRRL